MNLLFDLDGTLADPFVSIRASLVFAFSKCHLEPPHEELVRRAIGPPMQLSLQNLFQVPAERQADVLELYRSHQAEKGIYLYQMYPECRATLERLGEHRLFVATSKLGSLAQSLLEHFGHARYFEKIYGSERNGDRMRKGDLLRYLLAEEELEAKRCWMIGDRRHDIEGAHANGIEGVGVLWGFGSQAELLDAGAEHLVSTWHELEAIVKARAAHVSG